MLTAMEEKRSSGKCARCGRALSDPVSVERGMGPVCAGKTRAEEQRQGKESRRNTGDQSASTTCPKVRQQKSMSG